MYANLFGGAINGGTAAAQLKRQTRSASQRCALDPLVPFYPRFALGGAALVMAQARMATLRGDGLLLFR
ncbi:hypothetical protein ACFWJY_10930 [Streptomyces anulatus]|uniref:hypothetical protein n=1 Tax=Streptomyces anulatus TaxID=1892 RepID=UPI0036595AD7